MDHQQPARLPADPFVYKREVFSVLLRWSFAISLGVTVMQLGAYLRQPVWTLIPLIVGFLLLSAVSWLCLQRLSDGTLRSTSVLYLSTAIGVMGIVVLLTQKTLLLEAAMALAIVVLIATFLEPPAALLGWTGLCCLTYLGALAGRSLLSFPTIDYGPFEPVFLFSIPPTLLALTAVVGRVITQHLQQALTHSEATRADLIQSYKRLEERSNELLTQRAALQQALDEVRRGSEERAKLTQTIEGLSMPILPVLERVLVLPIIGTVDQQRAQQIRDGLLTAIEQQRARIVIIDVTGLSSIDTFVMRMLITIAQSARLLGAQPIVAGISPEAAESIVQLDVPHESFLALANLQAALDYAIKNTN